MRYVPDATAIGLSDNSPFLFVTCCCTRDCAVKVQGRATGDLRCFRVPMEEAEGTFF